MTDNSANRATQASDLVDYQNYQYNVMLRKRDTNLAITADSPDWKMPNSFINWVMLNQYHIHVELPSWVPHPRKILNSRSMILITLKQPMTVPVNPVLWQTPLPDLDVASYARRVMQAYDYAEGSQIE